MRPPGWVSPRAPRPSVLGSQAPTCRSLRRPPPCAPFSSREAAPPRPAAASGGSGTASGEPGNLQAGKSLLRLRGAARGGTARPSPPRWVRVTFPHPARRHRRTIAGEADVYPRDPAARLLRSEERQEERKEEDHTRGDN
ncbi:sterile alpha motif domain-containing protein 1-like [Perognathus longimembris pacificus]|uniref:sterile alpha motif domain-containing protein 1-like n=1 Tax=Perognathus longimembris pacificus TaxID=214514 RepID=UPI002019FABF|nr:sterile alpha motif domain-containing protein 1-like [Perognathus longimembris pacificus]